MPSSSTLGMRHRQKYQVESGGQVSQKFYMLDERSGKDTRAIILYAHLDAQKPVSSGDLGMVQKDLLMVLPTPLMFSHLSGLGARLGLLWTGGSVAGPEGSRTGQPSTPWESGSINHP